MLSIAEITEQFIDTFLMTFSTKFSPFGNPVEIGITLHSGGEPQEQNLSLFGHQIRSIRKSFALGILY